MRQVGRTFPSIINCELFKLSGFVHNRHKVCFILFSSLSIGDFYCDSYFILVILWQITWFFLLFCYIVVCFFFFFSIFFQFYWRFNSRVKGVNVIIGAAFLFFFIFLFRKVRHKRAYIFVHMLF
jgi:hypothetical protein